MKKTGTVQHVRWTNGTFSIISFWDSESGSVITCKGNIPNPTEGVRLDLEGEMVIDPKYGEQFKVSCCSVSKNMSLEGIIAYLSSGFIKGVGKITAKAIVSKFGADTLTVIENRPELLASVRGVSPKKAEQIHKAHMDHNVYMDIYNLFNGQVTDHQVTCIFERYGSESVRRVKQNPYRLIYEIDGFGFKKVDALAKSYGIPLDSDVRIGAAIGHVLKQIAEKGHCFASAESVEAQLDDLLGFTVNNERVAEILLGEIRSGHLIYEAEADRLYLSSIYNAEVYCAGAVAKLINAPCSRYVSSDSIYDAIENMEAISGFDLEDDQKAAIRQSLRKSISVITGGPGTGKTTIIKAILAAWNDTSTALLVAPTGKASRRMSDVSDGAEASTIHKLLGAYDVKPERYKNFKGLVVCDEASMLDINMAAKLLRFVIETNSSIVLIGDINQLPPIGAGNFFRDLVKTPVVPTVTLKLSHRNTGSIARNAASINEGGGFSSLVFDDRFSFISASNEEIFQRVVETYLELVRQYGLSNVCCLVPTRKAGTAENRHVSSDDLNKEIREILNPKRIGAEQLSGCPFRLGDRVMETVNDYERNVFNGDCGVISDINTDENTLTVQLDTGVFVEYNIPQTQNLVFAYAMTVHKSQGSEYRAIVFAAGMQHYIMLQRNLLYTGVTRAKEKVVMIGESKAINIAIKTVPAIERNTCLKQRIQEF